MDAWGGCRGMCSDQGLVLNSHLRTHRCALKPCTVEECCEEVNMVDETPKEKTKPQRPPTLQPKAKSPGPATPHAEAVVAKVEKKEHYRVDSVCGSSYDCSPAQAKPGLAHIRCASPDCTHEECCRASATIAM